MNKLKVLGVVILAIFMVASISIAQDEDEESGSTKAGQAGAQYLKIGIDARAIGMSDAIVALVDDSTGVYWNPAGIANVEGTDVSFSDIEWISDVRVMTGTFAHTFNFGTVGAIFQLVTMGEIQVTDENESDYYTGETYSPTDMVIGGSYARRLIPEFSVGVTAKYLRETIYEYTAQGIAFDVGIQYYTGIKSLKLGFAISNFGPDMGFSGSFSELQDDGQTYEDKPFGKHKLPIAMRLGIAYTLFEESDMHTLNLAFDTYDPTDGEPMLNMGAEYWIKNMIAVRGGYTHLTGELRKEFEKKFSVGGGVKVSKIRADFAYTDFGRLEQVYRFSFGASF